MSCACAARVASLGDLLLRWRAPRTFDWNSESAPLIEGEACVAIFFLEALYEKTGADELGGLLGGMSLPPGSGPADPAVWVDWQRAIEQARAARSGCRAGSRLAVSAEHLHGCRTRGAFLPTSSSKVREVPVRQPVRLARKARFADGGGLSAVP